MKPFDYFTLAFAAQFAFFALALATFLVVRNRMRSEPVLTRWIQGLSLTALISLTHILFNVYETRVGSALSGFVQIFGVGLLMDAVALLGGNRAPRAAILLPGIALACAQLLQADDPESRRMLFYLVAGGQFIACAALALSATAEVSLRSRVLLAAGFLIGVVAFAWRAIELTSQALAFSAEAPGARATLGFLINYVSLLWTSIMLLQIHFERSDAASKRLVTLDPLTGAFNRRSLLQMGQREIARAQRRSHALTVLHLRIDDATIPRDAGARDRILVHLSKTLAATLQRQDIIGRLDEMEFGVILPGTSVEEALNVADRIRVRIAGSASSETGNAYSVSIGIAERAANELQTGQILAHAEAALFAARAGGGDCVVAAEARQFGRAAISQSH
jgi:diguanylate cyclase (GGDEF)-like protein